MDDKKYEELLDKAYTELPEVLYTKGRFEIPKVTGKLIKSKTLITNFKDIAKTLARDEEHLLKYFLREAGVRGDINFKGVLILYSRFQPDILNKIIKKYYESYVQCPNCRNPDTILTNDNTSLKCKACGYETTISKL